MEKIIRSSQKTFEIWRESSIATRKKFLLNVAEILERNKAKYALLITKEIGKPIAQSEAEIEKCVFLCHYYSNNFAKFLKPKKQKKAVIRFDPLGIILGIMPWNYPFWQVIRFAIPTIISGNVVLLKHSSDAKKSAKMLQEIFNEACETKNLLTNLNVSSKEIPEILANKNIKAVSLTGGKRAGQEVAKCAGENIKKCLLELGGSDPYIILKDANLNLAAKICAQSRMINAGQSCIGAKRVIVVQEIFDEFVEKIKVEMEKYQIGDPLKYETNLGAMINEKQRDQLHSQVQESIKQGAKLILGGKIPNAKGAFYPATILVDVKKGMMAYEDELFGPVSCIIKAESETDAVFIANDSDFGLGAAIFSKNVKRAKKLAEKIEAGTVAINDFVKSNPHLPFGGVKQSGFGRELADYGIYEFVNIKVVT